MSNPRYSAEFKEKAVGQVLDRGYSVKAVTERIGVSAHSHLGGVSPEAFGRASSDGP